MQISELKPGIVLNNEMLVQVFKCGNQGGMRRSHKTNTLVLISDHTKSLYEDWWENNLFYYTGMGKLGDQNLDFQQNKTLSQSETNGVDVHLFECFIQNSYIYVGQMCLVKDPYISYQLDQEGKQRRVYIFPLKCKSVDFYIQTEVINSCQYDRQKNIQKLSDAQLQKIALNIKPKKTKRLCVTPVYSRNIYLSEWVKRLADGICQLCLEQAPFVTVKGVPYLETHHIHWLSQGGSDSLENMVALCPNCHKKMHIVNNEKGIQFLRSRVEARSYL